MLEISGNENKYTNFVNEKFKKLHEIEQEIAKQNSMIVVQEGKIHKLIRIIKKIIFNPRRYEIKKEN